MKRRKYKCRVDVVEEETKEMCCDGGGREQ